MHPDLFEVGELKGENFDRHANAVRKLIDTWGVEFSDEYLQQFGDTGLANASASVGPEPEEVFFDCFSQGSE